MDSELKARLIAFIGSLDDTKMSQEEIREANLLYGMLTRKPGRQPGRARSMEYRAEDRAKDEARRLLADSGPSGKELSE